MKQANFDTSKSKKVKKLLNSQTDFYDQTTNTFNTGEEMKIVHNLGTELESPKFNFTQVENILEHRIKDLRMHVYSIQKSFSGDKKQYDEIISDANNDVEVMEKDMFFRIKGNFETIANDINEQKSLNLLYQKQITGLKKDKNETMMEINKLLQRLDSLEDVLGINMKEKREKLEKKGNMDKLPAINLYNQFK